jgi:hypothetical protein
MIDPPTWHEALDTPHWTPTAPVTVVMRVYERYDKLPTPQ